MNQMGILSRLLPDYIMSVVGGRLNADKIYEFRIRAGKPLLVNYGGVYYYLTKTGICDEAEKAIVCDTGLASDIVVRASEYSLYAVNNHICEGYITVVGGIRIGISGEIVYESDKIKTIKNFNSVNIRLPHEITDCALKAFTYLCDKELRNTLIVSPPGAGKTTLLRDLTRLIGSMNPVKNVLLVDERSELASVYKGIPQLDVGLHTDVVTGCSKAYAFSQGIRSLRPDVIVTDELAGAKDIEAAAEAMSSGVKVIASAHAGDHLDLGNKSGFESLVKRRLFQRYVDISDRFGPGTYDGIFDENFNCIYYP